MWIPRLGWRCRGSPERGSLPAGRRRGCREGGGLLACLALVSVLTLTHAQVATDAGMGSRRPPPPGMVTQQDVCFIETFKASCPLGQVLVIKEAVYGRMELGRCVDEDFGNIGCQRDALPDLDDRCSGRQSCTMPVMELQRKTNCKMSLTGYLKVAYTCVVVIPCLRQKCEGSDFLQLTETSGVLASATVAETACGSSACPYVIQVLPGQRLNVTLMDFSHLDEEGLTDTPRPVPLNQCHRFATIIEDSVRKDITTCRQEYSRERNAFTSLTNSIQIELYASSALHYLFSYQAYGCPDLGPVDNAKVTREDDQVKVTCLKSKDVFFLTCVGTEWQGRIGICPGYHSGGSSSNVLDATKSPYGMLVVVGVGVALGVVIGVLLLAFALLYMRRRSRHVSRVTRNPLLCDTSPFRDSNKPGSFAHDGSQFSRGGALIYTPEHNYTTTLHPKRPLPVPAPHVPNTDLNLGEHHHQCNECNIAHMGPPPGLVDINDYPMTSGHLGAHPSRPSPSTATGPTSTPSSTSTSKDHIYETPTFPLQQLAQGGGRIHSADGIAPPRQASQDAGEDGRSSRTN